MTAVGGWRFAGNCKPQGADLCRGLSSRVRPVTYTVTNLLGRGQPQETKSHIYSSLRMLGARPERCAPGLLGIVGGGAGRERYSYALCNVVHMLLDPGVQEGGRVRVGRLQIGLGPETIGFGLHG